MNRIAVIILSILSPLFYQTADVCFENVLVEHMDIVILRKGIFENRYQPLVDFNRFNKGCPLCEFRREDADSGTDLNYQIFIRHARPIRDARQYVAVGDEVLS